MLDFQYSDYNGKIFHIKKERRKRAKACGFIKVNKELVNDLFQSLEISRSIYSISDNFREKLEKVLFPRFNEINDAIWSKESLPEEFEIEITKENSKDLLYLLSKTDVNKLLLERRVDLLKLESLIKKVKFSKVKH